MRLLVIFCLFWATPALAIQEKFLCPSNGFGSAEYIDVLHDPASDTLTINNNVVFAGQNNPKTPLSERADESLWFKAKTRGDGIKTTLNVYLYDTWILIETIELPILKDPCTLMTCEEQQTIYRLAPCRLLR